MEHPIQSPLSRSLWEAQYFIFGVITDRNEAGVLWSLCEAGLRLNIGGGKSLRVATITHVSFISPKHISQGFRSSPEMNIRISLCDKRISTVIFFCADAWLGFGTAQDLGALYLNI